MVRGRGTALRLPARATARARTLQIEKIPGAAKKKKPRIQRGGTIEHEQTKQSRLISQLTLSELAP